MKPKWKTPELEEFSKIFLLLKSEKEVLAFLRDVCTITELQEMAKRWKVAKLLEEGKPIREIAEETGMSTTTVSRINQWKNTVGEGGYDLVLSRLKS